MGRPGALLWQSHKGPTPASSRTAFRRGATKLATIADLTPFIGFCRSSVTILTQEKFEQGLGPFRWAYGFPNSMVSWPDVQRLICLTLLTLLNTKAKSMDIAPTQRTTRVVVDNREITARGGCEAERYRFLREIPHEDPFRSCC